MPWKESCPVDKRMRFGARLIEGHRMSDHCREFEIPGRPGANFLTAPLGGDYMTILHTGVGAVDAPNVQSLIFMQLSGAGIE